MIYTMDHQAIDNALCTLQRHNMNPSLNSSTPKESVRGDQSRKDNDPNTELQSRTITLYIPKDADKRRKVEVTLSSLGSIGKAIKWLRNALGYSQEELASSIPLEEGISRSYLSRIESGKASNPTLSAFRMIAEALCIEIETLVFLGLDTTNKAITELELIIGVKEQLLKSWANGLESKANKGIQLSNMNTKPKGATTNKAFEPAVSAA